MPASAPIPETTAKSIMARTNQESVVRKFAEQWEGRSKPPRSGRRRISSIRGWEMMKLMALRRLVHERGFAHAEIAHGLAVFRYVAGKARMLVVMAHNSVAASSAERDVSQIHSNGIMMALGKEPKATRRRRFPGPRRVCPRGKSGCTPLWKKGCSGRPGRKMRGP